ncbi:Na(+) H(+) antiporter subunit A [Bacillus sp. JCM 19046]|nr:Na(+) H(+) antiporter subunit A [Bacillus sp. JCM 19046]
MSSLHLAIILPFLIAIVIPLIYPFTKRIHTGWFVLLVPSALFAYFVSRTSDTANGGAVMEEMAWVPSLDIHFNAYLDGLGLLFALLITGIGALVVLYSIFYLDKTKEKLSNFYVYLLMFMGAMLGIVLSDNLIVLYIFWEVTSLSSALLISYWFTNKGSIFGARKSMLITVFGGFAMMAGFILLYVETGTFSIQSLIGQADIIMQSPFFIPALILVLIGAFTKSAQFPFHFWLPDAMEAPTPVSAYLHSATMVKAGIYLVARTTPIFAGAPEWFWIIVITGLTTLIWGSVSAVRQRDLKGILAFSTISQLGLLMTLLGVGSSAFNANSLNESALYGAAIATAVIHLINHATFKGSLFMAVGIIDHETGTRDINKLGGLMAIMPITFTISLVGLASMAGIPPFNGFISKEMFFTEMLTVTSMNFAGVETWGYVMLAIAWIASIFTFLYCAILFFKTFFGRFQKEQFNRTVHEAPLGMLISPVILGSLVILFGLFPNLLVTSVIEPAVASILPHVPVEQLSIDMTLWHGINTELLMSLGVIGIGSTLYLTYPKWKSIAIMKHSRDPFNRVYDKSLDGLSSSSEWITKLQMTGRLRDYFAYMLVFIVALLAYAFVRSNSFTLSFTATEETPVYLYAITFLLILSTIALLFMKGRIQLIITIGVVGFLMALLFAVFSAQDLALTQLLIETVTVVLLLLAFRHLPEVTKEIGSRVRKSLHISISIAVGILVFLISVSAFALRTEANFTPISEFFIENSYKLAGGENMVNVILVDFRGLDTILEVLVLAIVGLAILMMVKHRFKGGEDV